MNAQQRLLRELQRTMEAQGIEICVVFCKKGQPARVTLSGEHNGYQVIEAQATYLEDALPEAAQKFLSSGERYEKVVGPFEELAREALDQNDRDKAETEGQERWAIE